MFNGVENIIATRLSINQLPRSPSENLTLKMNQEPEDVGKPYNASSSNVAQPHPVAKLRTALTGYAVPK